ncbi:GSCOCT00014061001.2-RA-CDS [Cotesia congregata]|uniref:Venom protein 26 n=1 Tax=Cotesia congregata TaxID=51543 RepID=A0A8J2HHE2_COTCN|nr:GSCOCT00014061001.2-RA-CDS [Cotesia congregata]CAG5095402.1 Putative venom protein 26 [Cotesia congregata]
MVLYLVFLFMFGSVLTHSLLATTRFMPSSVAHCPAPSTVLRCQRSVLDRY